MSVSSLNETQHAKLTEAIEQAMTSAAAYVLLDPNAQAEIQRYARTHAGCSVADAISVVMKSFAANHLKYRPFEFDEFLEWL